MRRNIKGLFEIKECEMEERKYHRNRIDDALCENRWTKKCRKSVWRGIWNVRTYNT